MQYVASTEAGREIENAMLRAFHGSTSVKEKQSLNDMAEIVGNVSAQNDPFARGHLQEIDPYQVRKTIAEAAAIDLTTATVSQRDTVRKAFEAVGEFFTSEENFRHFMYNTGGAGSQTAEDVATLLRRNPTQTQYLFMNLFERDTSTVGAAELGKRSGYYGNALPAGSGERFARAFIARNEVVRGIVTDYGGQEALFGLYNLPSLRARRVMQRVSGMSCNQTGEIVEDGPIKGSDAQQDVMKTVRNSRIASVLKLKARPDRIALGYDDVSNVPDQRGRYQQDLQLIRNWWG